MTEDSYSGNGRASGKTGRSLALIASSAPDLRKRCAGAFLEHDVDIHVAGLGVQVVDWLHKCLYDVIVIDDSMSDMGAMELSLYVSQLAPNRPALFLAGENFPLGTKPWRACRRVVVGEVQEVQDKLERYLHTTSPGYGQG